MMRSRTSFLVSARNAPRDLLLAALELLRAASRTASALTRSSSASRSCLPAMVSAWASSALTAAVTRLQDVVLVVQEDAGTRAVGLAALRGQLGLRLAQHLDERLGGLQAVGDDLLGRRARRRRRPAGPVWLGGLGLDHHDRDVAVVEHAAGDDHVEDGVAELGVGREGDPLALDQRDADAADRAGERQAGQLGGGGGGVDRDHVVQVVRVQRHDGRDDLDLVAQALGEGRAQRPVDQAAGEDRVLGRAGPRGGRTSRGSGPRRTSAPRRPPSAGRSRAGPWGASTRWSPTGPSSRRPGRPRRSRRPAGPAGPSRSGRCAVPNGPLSITASVVKTPSDKRYSSVRMRRTEEDAVVVGPTPPCGGPVFDRSPRVRNVPKATTEDRRPTGHFDASHVAQCLFSSLKRMELFRYPL